MKERWKVKVNIEEGFEGVKEIVVICASPN